MTNNTAAAPGKGDGRNDQAQASGSDTTVARAIRRRKYAAAFLAVLGEPSPYPDPAIYRNGTRSRERCCELDHLHWEDA